LNRRIKDTKIKFDFNLLMSGTWVLDNREEGRIFKFEKKLEDGKIIIYNPIDVPSPKDSKLLDYLMLKAQEQDWTDVLVLPTLSQICRDLNMPKSKKTVDRLKKSFEILSLTRIQFHNCFINSGILEHFEEGEWQVINIGIINDYGFLPTKGRGNPIRVKVVFDKNFLSICKYSLGYKLIPYAPIQGLRDTAYALYKWAWRWFNNEKGYGERWIGNGRSLVEWYKNELNSTAKYKYPSKVLERIRSAIEQLNKNDEVPFYFVLKEEKGKYKIEIYRKEQCTLKLSKREIPFDKLPKILQKTVIELIKKKKHIKDPYALARSMGWRELEVLLKNVVIVNLVKEAWGLFKLTWEMNPQNKELFDSTAIAVEELEDRVQVAFPKQVLKGINEITKFLDIAMPRWKEWLNNASGMVRGEEILVKD
jgi:hypothetical protein